MSGLKTTILIGFTVFSMFFGAGNAVFPLVLGLEQGTDVFSGVLGLLVSGIILPFLGIIAVSLRRGKLDSFLEPLGKTPSRIVVGILVLLLGPLGVMPRCVTVAYACFQPYAPGCSLAAFSVLFCLLALACVWQLDKVVALLGKLLSPLLLGCLAAIIIMGLWHADAGALSYHINPAAILSGFKVGYGTMDLLAALFFAPTVWLMTEQHLEKASPQKVLTHLSVAALGSFVALGLIYFGLAAVAAQTPQLSTAAREGLLHQLSNDLLGPQFGAVADLAIALACLTTVIGLSVTMSQCLARSYPRLTSRGRWLNACTLSMTACLAPLGFSLIMAVLDPLLDLIYPGIIALTVLSLAAFCGLRLRTKLLVYATILASMYYRLVLG